MITNVPKVTGRLREKIHELAVDPSDLVNHCYGLLAQIDTSYARLPAPLKHDFLDALRHTGKLWLNSLLSGESPSPEEVEVIAATGRRRAHQGVTLASLLRAYRVGSREIWSAVLNFAQEDIEARDELLFAMSRYLLEYFDSMSQTVAQAYLDEQYQRLRWRDSLRYELVTLVFQFPEDGANFEKVCGALGLDATLPRIALTFDLELSQDTPRKLEGELDRFTLVAARHFKVAHEDLVRVFHRGRLIIWTPCVRGETVVAADRKVADATLTLLKSVPEIAAIGVGLMNQGPAGWAMSVDEALKALEFGSRTSAQRKIHLYSDIAVNEGARRTDNVLRYLNSLLERLSEEPELLLTLQTYFDQQQRRKVAADALGIHPNTLNHRLEKVESLLGANLEDSAWVAKLHVALKLRQQSLGA